MKIENVTTTRLSNPFDNYRLQSAQNIYSGNKSELKEFVSAIGATKMLESKIHGYRFERIKNLLHITKQSFKTYKFFLTMHNCLQYAQVE